MRAKKVFLIGVLGVVVLCLLGYQRQLAAAGKERPARLAVVNLRELFQNCKKNAEYEAKAAEQEGKALAELEKLAGEVEAVTAALKTRKIGTSDYWALREELMLKQSGLEAKKEFYQQQMTQRSRRWTEELYQQILKCVAEAAKRKGIDIVLAKDQMNLPAASGIELMLTIRLRELLYASEDLDITKDVMALLDAHSN